MSRERAHANATNPGPRPEETHINIPEGTVVDLEAARAISPCELDEGDEVSFRVALPLTVDGVVLIAVGAAAVGIVTAAAAGRGRRADLTWGVKEMTTPDGATFAVRLSFTLTYECDEPDGRDAKAAALMFPVVPLALAYGSRQWPRAYLPARGHCRASVRGDVPARGVRDEED